MSAAGRRAVARPNCSPSTRWSTESMPWCCRGARPLASMPPQGSWSGSPQPGAASPLDRRRGRRRSRSRSCRPRSYSISAFPAGGCGAASHPTAPSGAARSGPPARNSSRVMPEQGSEPPPDGSRAASAALRWCSPTGPRSAPSSRSTAAARRCGRAADGSGRRIWPCPARLTRSRRSPTRRLIRKTSRSARPWSPAPIRRSRSSRPTPRSTRAAAGALR